MRIPYYLAQYHQEHAASPRPKATVVPVLAVAAIVLVYVGALTSLLLGFWS